jgi:hypothetical protein
VLSLERLRAPTERSTFTLHSTHPQGVVHWTRMHVVFTPHSTMISCTTQLLPVSATHATRSLLLSLVFYDQRPESGTVLTGSVHRYTAFYT